MPSPRWQAVAATRLGRAPAGREEDDVARSSALGAVRLAPGSPSAALGETLAAGSLLGYPGRQDEVRGHAERAREQGVDLDLPAGRGG